MRAPNECRCTSTVGISSFLPSSYSHGPIGHVSVGVPIEGILQWKLCPFLITKF